MSSRPENFLLTKAKDANNPLIPWPAGQLKGSPPVRSSIRLKSCGLLRAGAGVSPVYIAGTLRAYLIIVADAADAVSVNFFGRCKFLQI